MKSAGRALSSSHEMHRRLDWIGELVDRESDGEGLDLSPQAAALFDEMSRCFAAGPDYLWLRNRRNHLLHADDPRPAVTSADLVQEGQRLEQEARRAIGLMVKAVTSR